MVLCTIGVSSELPRCCFETGSSRWAEHRLGLVGRLLGKDKEHPSVRDDVSSVYIDEVTNLEGALCYMLKAPQKATRMNYFPNEWTSPSTGKVFKPGVHAQKDWLRTGDRVRLGDVMAGLRMDEIVFGNRSQLASAICEELCARARAHLAGMPQSSHPPQLWRFPKTG